QLDGENQEVSLSPQDVENNGLVNHTLTGLSPAIGHEVKVTAVDHSGNASAGVTNPGVTFLANPSNLEADGFGGRANLTWSPSQPHSLVKHYAVYVQPEDFVSV